jgi:ATP-dependent exoDNAse (exonuclease V) alpha subunit
MRDGSAPGRGPGSAGRCGVAIYHLSVRTVSRASGRSAVGAAAYRSATRLVNERDGVAHDYARRGGVEDAFVVAPAGAEWALDRGRLWNAAEAAERRKDAKVAREYELALPHELGPGERRELVEVFAREVVERFGVAADAAVHAPGREGDARNWHAHVLTTTRAVTAEGLGAKTRELDVRQTSGPLVEELRAAWAREVNAALERVQAAERVDHRSFERQGLDLLPTQHLGVGATALERQAAREQAASGLEREAEGAAAGVGGPATRIGRHNAEVQERNGLLEAAREAWEAARSGLEALERAAVATREWVLGLARGLGERAAAERAQEQERAREAELARQRELERQAVREAEWERERSRERERGLDLEL